MQVIIKDFGIVFCSIYLFSRLLKIQYSKKDMVTHALFLVSVSLFSYVTEYYLPYTTVLMLVLTSLFYFKYISALSWDIIIPSIITIYAFSYAIFMLSVFLTGILVFSFHIQPLLSGILVQFIIFIISLFLMRIPFFFKRLKKGMPFLRDGNGSVTGIIICITVLFTYTILGENNGNHIYLILIFFIYICAIFIYIYWRASIHRTYLNKITKRNLDDLNELISKDKLYIEQLEAENKELAKIIHKDNKLIPAMEYAVQSYLNSTANEYCDSTDASNIGKDLLMELSKMSAERKNIIEYQDKKCKVLPTTSIDSLDHLLQYMQQKALTKDVTLDVIVSCKMKGILDFLSEEELKTLLADLIDNAIIANTYNDGHNILVNFSTIANAYTINVFDSGIPFTKEVLYNLGNTQITTHSDDSGSGIGMMTICELLRKHNASFIINELASENGEYTKEISIVFNKLGEYTLKTNRDKEELDYLRKRKNLKVIMSH